MPPEHPIHILLVEDGLPVTAPWIEQLAALPLQVEITRATGIPVTRPPKGGNLPDLIFLALGEAATSGLDALPSLLTLFVDRPLVLLVPADQEEIALRGIERGATDYLLTPVEDGDALYRVIRRALARQKGWMRQVGAEEPAGWDLLDAMSGQVAILDEQGRLVRGNRTWRTSHPAGTLVGSELEAGESYLEWCRHRVEKESGIILSPAARSALLEGRQEALSIEYRREEAGSEQWYLLRIIPFTSGGQARRLVLHEEITERRQVQEALGQAEARFQRLVEQIPAIVYTSGFGVEGKWHYLSPQLESLLGYTVEEWMNDPGLWFQQIHPADRARCLAEETVALKQRDLLRIEYRMFTRDGELRWFRDESTVVRDEEGRPLFLQGVMYDITEHKRAEASLRAADQSTLRTYGRLLARLAQLARRVGAAQDLTAVYRALLEFAVVSVSCSRLYVSLYDADQEACRSVYAWEEGREVDPGQIEPMPLDGGPQGQAMRTGQIIVTQAEAVKINGGRSRNGGEGGLLQSHSIIAVPMMSQGYPIGVFEIHYTETPASRSEPITAMGMAANLAAIATENVRLLEQERQQRVAAELSEQRYRLLSELVSDYAYAYRIEPEGKVRLEWVTGAYARITGYSYEEVRKTGSWEQIVHPEDLAIARQQVDHIFKGRRSISEYRIITREGEVRWLRDSCYPVADHENEEAMVTYVYGAAEDITERKQAEAALAESEQRYKSLFEYNPDAVYSFDLEGHFTSANPACERLTGYSVAELLGAPFHSLVAAEARERAADYFREALAGETQNYETVLVHRDGKRIEVDITMIPIIVGGRITGIYGVAKDITARKQHEREQQASVMMAAALRAAQTRADMPPLILQQLSTLLSASATALVRQEPTSGDCLIELATGDWATASGTHLVPGGNMSEKIISTRELQVWKSARANPRLSPIHRTRPDQAVACLPLVAHDHCIGVLWVGRGKPFADYELRLFAICGEIAANALYHATLHEQTEQRVRRLGALHTIDATISASLDLRLTLDVFLEQVQSQLAVDATAILLLNRHLHLLQPSVARGFRRQALPRPPIRLGEGIAGIAAIERRLLQISNLDAQAELVRGEFREMVRREGFAACMAVPLVAKGQVQGVLELYTRRSFEPDSEWLDFLHTLAAQAAIAIDNTTLYNELQASNMELELAYNATIEGWSRALDLRDRETEGHSVRVTEMTVSLARRLDLDEESLIHIRRGALLHDIGKMGVPDSVLLKPGPLTEEEWEIMRRHPTYAYELLSPISFLRPALDIPYCHHERWDGSGYPRGLRGEQIPLAARLFTVVDIWDALRSNRPYRRGWQEAQVLEYIRLQAGTHLDPEAVALFFDALAEKRRK